jgi:N-methylhydantoinase A
LLSADEFSKAAREIEKNLEELQRIAIREYQNEKWTGEPQLECSIDMRYQGQGYELRIPWRRSPALLDDFHAAHERRFGYRHAGKKIEAVTLRLRATLPQKTSSFEQKTKSRAATSSGSNGTMYVAGKTVKCQVLDREFLSPGFSVTGPAIVNEYTATTVVPSGWRLSFHRSGSMLIEHVRKK